MCWLLRSADSFSTEGSEFQLEAASYIFLSSLLSSCVLCIRKTPKLAVAISSKIQTKENLGKLTERSTVPTDTSSRSNDDTDAINEAQQIEVKHQKKEKHKKWSIPWLRYTCGKVVNNVHFQSFIVILIVLNAIMMGIGTFDFVTQNPDVNSAFQKNG